MPRGPPAPAARSHVEGQGAGLAAAPLLGQGGKEIRVGAVCVVSRLLRRVESLGEEIGDLHRMTKPRQRLYRYVLERGVEGPGFGMTMDDKSM